MTYLEIFKEHYPNVDENMLYGDYCPAGFFEKGIDDLSDDCSGQCDDCWHCMADSEWCESGDYIVPESWKAEDPEEVINIKESEKELEALAAAVAEVNEKNVDCPYWNKKNTLYNKGYGVVSFECQKHSEEFTDPDKLKKFIAKHCYSGNHIWCNYCHEQEKPQITPAEISAPAQTAETAVFDMQTAEQTADVFNYAVLSAEMGDYLKRKEEQLKNEYMNFTANCGRIFAEAQEKLAGDNHYNGVFEKWIKSMGFAKSTVYRMIDVHKFYSSQIGTSKQAELFNNLSKSLQYEIAKPSAPPELVDKVMSGDITTHKEYIALKKELEEAKKSEEKAKAEYEEIFAENNENSRKLSEQLSKNTALQQQIKELESRPVDIQIQQPDEAEISVQAREMAQGLIRSAEAAADKRVREFQQELTKKDKELNELSEKLREAQASVLDAAFESNSESSTEQIKEFYEMLHSRALSALRDCFDFIGMDIPPESAKAIRSRLRTFGEVVEIYINELEDR